MICISIIINVEIEKIIEIIYQMVGKLLVAPWLPIFVRNMDIPNSLAPP